MFLSGGWQVQNCSRQRVPGCSRWKKSLYKLSWSSCWQKFALIIPDYHLFTSILSSLSPIRSLYLHKIKVSKKSVQPKWQGVYNSFLCLLNVCLDQNCHSQLFSLSPLKEKDPVLDLDFCLYHVFPCIFPLEEQLSVFFSSSLACLLSWREYPKTDLLLKMKILNHQLWQLKRNELIDQMMLLKIKVLRNIF